MFKTITRKRRFGLAALAATSVLAIAAVGSTGANFTDAKQGNMTGSVGSIKVVGSGGGGANGLDLQFVNLLPTEPQSVTASYTNTGLNTQDVWMVFNNADALHALNDLGKYGEVHIVANGTPVFDSANLNDGTVSTTCGVLAPTGCWPVPKAIKLASNLTPGTTGNVQFTFGYTDKLSGQSAAGGGAWNLYPLAAPTASGLPYQIVATQPNQAP